MRVQQQKNLLYYRAASIKLCMKCEAMIYETIRWNRTKQK